MLYYFELLHPGTIIEEIAIAALLKNRNCSIIEKSHLQHY